MWILQTVRATCTVVHVSFVVYSRVSVTYVYVTTKKIVKPITSHIKWMVNLDGQFSYIYIYMYIYIVYMYGLKHTNLTFMGPCIVNIFQCISNKMQLYIVYLYLETALHVSGGISTHYQEPIQLYIQHLVFVTPLLLPAVIVEELEPENKTHQSLISIYRARFRKWLFRTEGYHQTVNDIYDLNSHNFKIENINHGVWLFMTREVGTT